MRSPALPPLLSRLQPTPVPSEQPDALASPYRAAAWFNQPEQQIPALRPDIDIVNVSQRMPMLRKFTANDAEALADVYRDSVRTIGPQAYTQEQVDAWAIYPDEIEEFKSRLSRGLTLVAEVENQIAGFGQLEPDDHVAFLYCAGRYSRKGIGAIICRALEAHALAMGTFPIHTEASRISRPFFEKHGYSVVEVERVIRFGIEFERFRMVKKAPVSKAPEPATPSGRGSP